MKSVILLVIALVTLGATIGCTNSQALDPPVVSGQGLERQEATGSGTTQLTTQSTLVEPQSTNSTKSVQASAPLAEVKVELAQITLDRDNLNKELTNALAGQEANLDELSSMANGHAILQAALESELMAAREQLDSTLTQLSAANDRYDTALDRYNTLLSDLDQSEREIQDVRRELEVRSEQLLDANEQGSIAQSALDDLRMQVDETTKYLAVVTRYFEWVKLVKLLWANDT